MDKGQQAWDCLLNQLANAGFTGFVYDRLNISIDGGGSEEILMGLQLVSVLGVRLCKDQLIADINEARS